MIIAAGVFAAGIGVGVIVVVSAGIHREERRFLEIQRRREEQFFQTGEVVSGFMPEDAPDRVTWGARRLMNLHIRRQPAGAVLTAEHDLLVR